MIFSSATLTRTNPSLQKADLPEIDPNKIRKEGFWSINNLPITNNKSWNGQDVFLRHLVKKETLAKADHHKAMIKCRLCDAYNRDTRYSYKKWKWNFELKHYVEAHNLKPTLYFIKFVCEGK